jgi:hypothetical protein
MATKQSFSKEEIKTKIIRDRLAHIFRENQKSVAKILAYFIKRHKKNV